MKISRLLLLVATLVAPQLAHAEAAWVTFEPFHRNGIYAIGERVGWTLRMPLSMSQSPEKYSYTIRRDGAEVIKSGTVDLSSGAATIETTLDQPGMLYLRLTAPGPPAGAGGGGRAGGGPSPGERAEVSDALKALLAKSDPSLNRIFESYPDFDPLPAPALGGGAVATAPTLSAADADKFSAGAAVAPLDLKPSVPRPADFDSFWAAKLKLLAAIPVNAVLTAVAGEKPNVDLYAVKLDSVGSKVQGYLAVPKGGGRHPALVIYQYAGVYQLQPNVAADRAAEGWIAFDVSAHDIPPQSASGAPRTYAFAGETDKDKSYFLNMYLRDSRALDYIQTRPDWDGKTVVVMGTSMGGQQSVVTAGLNPQRVTAMIVDVPSGADTNADLHGRRAGYPNWPSTDPRVMATSLYFDPVNFASKIKAPSLVGFGFLDTTSPPAGVWTVFNQIPAPKEPVAMIESDHNSITPEKEEAFYRRSVAALEELRTTGSFTPNARWLQD